MRVTSVFRNSKSRRAVQELKPDLDQFVHRLGDAIAESCIQATDGVSLLMVENELVIGPVIMEVRATGHIPSQYTAREQVDLKIVEALDWAYSDFWALRDRGGTYEASRFVKLAAHNPDVASTHLEVIVIYGDSNLVNVLARRQGSAGSPVTTS
jgi:hypothetical protein